MIMKYDVCETRLSENHPHIACAEIKSPLPPKGRRLVLSSSKWKRSCPKNQMKTLWTAPVFAFKLSTFKNYIYLYKKARIRGRKFVVFVKYAHSIINNDPFLEFFYILGIRLLCIERQIWTDLFSCAFKYEKWKNAGKARRTGLTKKLNLGFYPKPDGQFMYPSSISSWWRKRFEKMG